MFDVESLLDEYGELIVRMDSGQEFELHKHNVEFQQVSDGVLMEIETGDEVEVVDTGKVESYRYHYDK